MKCEFCGEEDAIAMVEIEGTMLRACKNCSSFGNIKSKIETPIDEKFEEKIAIKHALSRPEFLQMIVPNYGRLIKEARERASLTQEDLGKKINERATIIHKTETGQIEPTLELARKLEKFFKISLITQYQETSATERKSSEKELTFGDLAKIKKR